MAIKPILTYPDPRLRTKAAAVSVFDAKLADLVADMLDTMYDAKGIGLAATQINVHQQVVVMDLSEAHNTPQTFINPRITVLNNDKAPYKEGCLSVPDSYEDVERPTKVRIDAQDAQGNPFSVDADELLAVCIQHEIDHLNGIVFVDHLSALKRNRIKDKLVKRAKAANRSTGTPV